MKTSSTRTGVFFSLILVVVLSAILALLGNGRWARIAQAEKHTFQKADFRAGSPEAWRRLLDWRNIETFAFNPFAAPASAMQAGTWTMQTSGTTDNLFDVHFLNDCEGWAIGGVFGTIKRTVNCGLTWTTVSENCTGFDYNSLRLLNSTTAWIGNEDGIGRTTNTGGAWTCFSTFNNGQFITHNGLAPISTDVAWSVGIRSVGTANNFFRYNFSGTPSQEQFSAAGGSTFFDISCPDANNCWAVGAGGKIVRIANAGGTPTLTQQTSPTTQQLNDVFMLDLNTGWAVGNSGTILATTNGGTTWTPQTSGTTAALRGVGFRNANDGLVVGAGGANWSAESSGITTDLESVSFGNAGYAVGAGGKILKRTTGSCTVSISPPSFNFPGAGGSDGLSITAPAGCGWSVADNAAWLNFTSAVSGNGNGTVTFTVAANTGAARSATITVTGEVNSPTVPVDQSFDCNLNLTISPSSFTHPAAGAASSVNVNGLAQCNWTATTGDSWIHITSGSGAGNGTVSYTVDANAGPQRSGTITIGPRTFTVYQTGSCAGPWCLRAGGTANTLWSVYFLNENDGWIAGVNLSLRQTTDGGNTWTHRPVAGLSSSQGFFSVRFLDANIGWVGGTESVARTGNGGSSWTPRAEATTIDNNQIFPTSSTQAWAVGLDNGCQSHARYTFTGSAINSERRNVCPGASLLDVYFVDADNGWSVGSGGTIFRMTSGSGTFASVGIASQTSPTTQSLWGIHMLDLNTGYVVGNNGTILKTTNGGATWTPQTSGTTTNLRDVHFINANEGWAVGVGGLILRTTNGGATWTPETSGVTSDLNSVFFAGANVGYAVGGAGQIVKRTNCPAITVAPANIPAGTAGSAYSQTFTAGGGASPYMFSLSGTLPAGLSFDAGTATLSGTPTQTGNFPITVTATDSNGCAGSTPYTLTINCPTITVNPATLPNGAVSQPYNQTITQTGGIGTVNFSLTAGVLPPGLMLSTSGALTGTPSSGGTYPFTVTATDANNCTGARPYTIQVTTNPPPTINAVAITRQQGSAASNSTIANVSDADQAANTLGVTVNGGASATVNGITVSGISVSSFGVVTADVIAICAATAANFTLTVTDASSATANAMLTVTVTANNAPLLAFTGPQNVLVGGALNVVPTIGPSDNGSISSLVVQSITPSGFTGAITVNSFGVVAVSNAGPANSYTVTIRATDNCGATKDASFRLVVGQTCTGIGFMQPTGSPINAGSDPISMAVVDLNLDGYLDIATGNDGSDNVTILLGNGSGGFSQPSGSPIGVGDSPREVSAGDFNLDGKPDLAIPNYLSNNVTILLGNGSGGFSQASGSPISVANGATSLVVGDFNLDGKPDLAVANYLSNSVTLLLGNGSGGFSQPLGSPVNVGNHPRQMIAWDFNLDGKPDLATANEGSNNITILLGAGTGNFSQPAESPISVGGEPHSLAAGDFNLDGNPDMAVVNSISNNVTILLGNGDGGFASAAGSPVSVGNAPQYVAVGDLNLDGKPDLTVANHTSGNVMTLLGNGAGGFGLPLGPAFSPVVNAFSVAIGDFNQDGKSDFVAGAISSISIVVALNTCSPPAITATPIMLTAGTLATNLQIATISDATNAVSVTVNGGASATVNSVTVSGIGFDTAGVVTANVVASCAATAANFTLRVNYNGGAFAEASLLVTVTPNPPPTLAYAAVSVSAGGSTSNSPTAASDNGGITGFTVQNAGTYTGAISVNAAGVVSISNAVPVGTHTITIRATDNCGVTTDATFQVSVNGPPVITATSPMVKQGSPSANFMIGNAGDPNQAANTLTVTVNGGASATLNGVTISNLSIDNSGNLKADIIAACAATDANFTIRVTDTGGLFAETLLNVQVMANQPPTVGNYPSTGLSSGGGATVTPDAAPADNGSIQSIVATASPNTFTGTLSGNTTTGAVTITNANPPGSYVITVTVTDNCGATVERTFPLIVCPTITINPPALPNGVLGQAYAQTISQTGGVLPVNFSVSAGALPPGLILDPTTGELTGTPSQTGSVTFTIKATDANGCMGIRSYSVTVSAPPPSGGWSVKTSNTTNVLASVHFVDDNTGWAAGLNATFLRTTDGGLNWAGCNPGVSAANGFNSVRFVDANTGFVGGLFAVSRITNGCNQSRNRNLVGDFRNRFFATSATTVWSVGAGPFENNPQCRKHFRSDYNANGDVINGFQNIDCVATSALLDVYFVNADNGWSVGVGGAIDRVTNGSASFPTITHQTSGTTQSLNSVFMLDLNTGWAVGNSGTILKTVNGGTNWTAQTSNTNVNLNDVHFVNAGQGWAVGNGGTILVTTDGGATWTTESSPTTQDLFSLFFTNPSVGYAVGANGTIIKRTVCPTIMVLPENPALPPGVTGQPYSRTFTAGGGAAPYAFTVSAGTLPAGLSLNGATGVLSGTPTVFGTFSFDVRATDANGCVGTRSYTLTINCPAITVSATFPPSIQAGVPIQPIQFVANGGQPPYTFDVSAGLLPSGLALSSSGLLSGTPLQAGSFFFTVRATDANLCQGAASLAMTVTPCPTVTILPPTLPAGRAGQPYNQSLTGDGGLPPYSFGINGGTLPNGMGLSPAGLLSGTPTMSGTFNFEIKATDANGCMGTRSYSLVIHPPCSAIVITPENLPNTLLAASYNQTLTAGGGTAPYMFSLDSGTLPGGLNLSSSGALSGAATQTGVFPFAVKVTDNTGCMGTRGYTIVVSGSGPNNLMFYALPKPIRLLDTRAGQTGCDAPGAPIQGGAGGIRTQFARRTCDGVTIPLGAQAVTGNITVVPQGPGFLTLFPSSATQPTVANSNFASGEITNNVFTVGLGNDGAFKIFASATTHVVVDVTGYYAPPPISGAGGLYFHPLATPVRLLETRAGFTGCFAPGTPLVGNGDPNADPNLDLAVQGRSPIPSPCNSIPASAQVLVGNATSVFPGGGGYLTIYPSGGTRPLVASSNYAGTDVINGPFAVKLGPDGKFKIYTLVTTHLVVDILGYYSEDAVDANGAGLLFNPLPEPVRLLETRPGGPPLTGCTRTNAPIQGNINAATHTQPARSFCGLPASAQAVVGNASVVNTAGAGFLTLFPGNLITAPLVATSNYPAPATFGYNRHFFVGLSPVDGTFKVLTQFTTDLILDASGYFAP